MVEPRDSEVDPQDGWRKPSPRHRGQVGLLAQGAALGGAVAAPLAAILTHDGPLPVESLDWIVKNGSIGLALVIIFVLGAFSLWMLRDRIKLEGERHKEILDTKATCASELAEVHGRSAAKEEKLFRELIDARRAGDKLAEAVLALERLLSTGSQEGVKK